MSRSVYPARPAAYGVPAQPARVIHRVEVWTEHGYGTQRPLAEVLTEMQDAASAIAADGIDLTTIMVNLDYEHSDGYDGCDVTTQVVLHGERPATEAEVAQEHERQEQAKRQARASEVYRLRQALAEAERRLG